MRDGGRDALGVWLGFVLTAAAACGCRSPMSSIEALRDALIAGDEARARSVVDVPACNDPGAAGSAEACLDGAARAFGARHFSFLQPDQASAAAVAYALATHRAGAEVPAPDAWLDAVGTAIGAGADALREAVASSMAREVALVAHPVDDEASARAFLGAVARAIPGACRTYARLAAGAEVASFSPPESPDHAPCVQRDLERKDGPGAAYGDGLWRAAAGAAASWKEAGRRLAAGSGHAGSATRKALASKLAIVDDATAKLVVRSVTTSQSAGYGGGAGGPAGPDGPDGHRGDARPASP